MKRATSTPAGLNVKKITAYLKGRAKNRNAVRITCQGGSVYIITGYAAFKLPAVLYRDVIQPVTMQDAPADGVTIVSSDAGFVVNDPHQLTAAQMFQKFSTCKEEVKRTSILQEVEAKGKVWGTFRMFRNGSRPIMINSEYDAFVDHHEFVYHASNSPFALRHEEIRLDKDAASSLEHTLPHTFVLQNSFFHRFPDIFHLHKGNHDT